MLTSEVGGNSIQIVADVIGGETFAEVVGEMSGKRSVTSAEKDAREETLAAITVKCDDRVYMPKESRELFRMRWVDVVRCDMPFEVCRLMDSVIGRISLFGNPPSDDVGEFFKTAAVIRHDSKGSTKIAQFFYIWMLKQIAKCHEPT